MNHPAGSLLFSRKSMAAIALVMVATVHILLPFLLSNLYAMKLINGIAGILFSLLSFGQPAIKPLNIGDAAPAVSLGAILNYSLPAPLLSSFKGRLVILDFMNTFCGSCIEALPALDALQHKYGNRLQIFIVTNEPKERLVKFLKNNPVAKSVALPVITGDSVLEKLFPHYFVSHEAWLYDGKVQAITAADYVTEQNILTMLTGISPAWPIKNDRGEYDYTAPLLAVSVGNKEYLTGSAKPLGSILTGHLQGVALRYTEEADSLSNTLTIKAINFSIAYLYQHTLTDWQNFPISHIQLPTNDIAFFTYTKGLAFRDVWDENNTYCYELTLPLYTPPEIIKQKIQLDLDACLGVQSRFETRPTSCYILMEDSAAIAAGAVRDSYEKLSARAANTEVVFPSPVNLVRKLNQSIWGTPVFNGISENDLPIVIDESILTDIPALKIALRKQHLQLKEVTMNVSMLLLTHTGNNFTNKHQN